jgi:hypothetical protein
VGCGGIAERWSGTGRRRPRDKSSVEWWLVKRYKVLVLGHLANASIVLLLIDYITKNSDRSLQGPAIQLAVIDLSSGRKAAGLHPSLSPSSPCDQPYDSLMAAMSLCPCL